VQAIPCEFLRGDIAAYVAGFGPGPQQVRQEIIEVPVCVADVRALVQPGCQSAPMPGVGHYCVGLQDRCQLPRRAGRAEPGLRQALQMSDILSYKTSRPKSGRK